VETRRGSKLRVGVVTGDDLLGRLDDLIGHGHPLANMETGEPLSSVRERVLSAKAQGAEIKYIEIPGGDHLSAPSRTFTDVFDWFDAHKR